MATRSKKRKTSKKATRKTAKKSARGTTKKAATKKATGKKATGKKATGKKATGKKATGKKATGKKATGKKATGKKAKKAPARPSPRRSVSKTSKHVPTPALDGWITHTDLGSHDPAATKAWCAEVLGWSFRPSFPMPDGEYHLFTYSQQGGGGIHSVGATESPVSIPYVHVADAAAAFEKALRAGAELVSAPNRVMEGVTIAVVRAPGGVTIGLAGP